MSELAEFGFPFDPGVFHAIWEWRFPAILAYEGLTVRRALEGWPLLAETPTVGGNTSRFVDSSIERLEVSATDGFNQKFAVYVSGRELALRSFSSKESLAGLRYRKTSLYPSLHPRIPVQLPLSIYLLNRDTEQIEKKFALHADRTVFLEQAPSDFEIGKPCESATPGMYTCDLRIESSIFPD